MKWDVRWRGKVGKAQCHGCHEKDFGLHPSGDTETPEGLEWERSMIFPSSLLISLTSHSMTALESWLELGQDSYASLCHIITLGQVSLWLSASVGGEGNEASQMDCCENEKCCVHN